MVDTPTTRNRLRKQELGTNTNTWGDTKLNEVLDALDQAMDGVESIALTGSKTLTTSNYSTADEAKNRVLKFTGTLAAAAEVIVPSVEHMYVAVNAAGASVTIRTASGSGVSLPDGYAAAVYCDGSDVFNGSPTYLSGAVRISGALQVGGKIANVSAGTAAQDAINKSQMDAAIAAATTSSTAGTVKVSSTDTTNRYLGGAAGALQAGTGIELEVQSPGGDETLHIRAPRLNPGAFFLATV